MPHYPGERTYNFEDLLHARIFGLTVIAQAESNRSGSRWTVSHDRCGHVEILQGTYLRERRKNAPRGTRACRACTPK